MFHGTCIDITLCSPWWRVRCCSPLAQRTCSVQVMEFVITCGLVRAGTAVRVFWKGFLPFCVHLFGATTECFRAEARIWLRPCRIRVGVALWNCVELHCDPLEVIPSRAVVQCARGVCRDNSVQCAEPLPVGANGNPDAAKHCDFGCRS